MTRILNSLIHLLAINSQAFMHHYSLTCDQLNCGSLGSCINFPSDTHNVFGTCFCNHPAVIIHEATINQTCIERYFVRPQSKDCLPCPVGHYCSLPASEKNCWRGMYSNTNYWLEVKRLTNQTKVEYDNKFKRKCPVGTYNDEIKGYSLKFCKSCPVNYTCEAGTEIPVPLGSD